MRNDLIAWIKPHRATQSILRAAREAQGFTRLIDFARNAKQLRAKRAKLREWHPDPVRRGILDKLERIIDDRKDLTITARRIARFWWKPRIYVWWCGGTPQAQNGVRLAGRYYDKRNVMVPAAWLLARLGADANVATRMRQALRKVQEKTRKERQREAAIRRATAPSLGAPDSLGWRGWRLKDGRALTPMRNAELDP